MQKSTKSSYKGNALYALPTASEQRALRETTNLLNSNILSLEIDELISEVRPKYRSSLNEALKSLHATLKNIDPSTVNADDLALQEKSSLGLKLLHSKALSIDFEAPSRIDVIGSYLLRSVSKPGLNIDVSVTMPSSIFVAKDYLNHRYSDKRALYVYVMANILKKKTKLFRDVHFIGFCNDTSKPIIEYSPVGVKGKFKIRIYPVISKNTFAPSKLIPQRNNVRRKLHPDADQPSTPFYNASILEDMCMFNHLSLLHQVVVGCPAFAEASMLCKVWHAQRSRLPNSDDFNGFLLTMILLYFLQKGYISKHMNAIQMFRIFMEKLSDMDLTTTCIQINGGLGDGETPFELSYDPLHFYDVSIQCGWLNISSRVSAEAARNLKHDALISYEAITSSNGGLNAFEALFMTPVSFWTKFDQYVSIPVPLCPSEEHMTLEMANKLIDIPSYEMYFQQQLIGLLSHGLSDRVTMTRSIISSESSCQQWGIGESPYPRVHNNNNNNTSFITIGFLLAEDDISSRRMDKGPSAEDTENSQKFRQFWGDKAELRRFKDGTIKETVMWEAQDKHGIIEAIITYLIRTHLPMVDTSSIRVVASQLDSWLLGGVRALSYTMDAASAFDELSSALKGLGDMLPLPIKEVSSGSSSLRYTSVRPPVPHVFAGATSMSNSNVKSTSMLIASIDVTITFIPSTKWPEDIDAMRAVKTAFLLKVGTAIQVSSLIPITGVHFSTDFVIIYHKGFAFKCKIFHDREFDLLNASENKMDNTLAGDMKMNSIVKPSFASIMKGFHWKHAAFGGTARLAKRWLHAQMLTNHFSEELVELIVASLFISPEPLSAPSSALVGFVRFIHLLASFDWSGFPLIVDVTGEITSEDYTTIESAFTSGRNTVAMYVVCGLDRDNHWKSQWSASTSRAVLSHVRSLAGSVRTTLQRLIAGALPESAWEQLFSVPTKLFDVTLKCSAKHLPPMNNLLDATTKGNNNNNNNNNSSNNDEVRVKKRGSAYKTKVYKNLLAASWKQLLVDLDPLSSYISELEQRYGHLALFFYNGIDGDAIGITWKPAAFLPQPFKLTNCQDRLPMSEGRVVPDVCAILSDISQLGSGVVKQVILH